MSKHIHNFSAGPCILPKSVMKKASEAVVELDNQVLIIEFKLTNSQQALDQIETKKYYEPYLNTDKDIKLIGISFSSEDRNIEDFFVKDVII